LAIEHALYFTCDDDRYCLKHARKVRICKKMAQRW
jgi:hypothetical protein